jgi:hypothetical protein
MGRWNKYFDLKVPHFHEKLGEETWFGEAAEPYRQTSDWRRA